MFFKFKSSKMMRVFYSFFFIVVLSFLSHSSFSQEQQMLIQQKISELRNEPGFINASINIYVADAESEEIIIETHPELSLVPASTLKLITSATALEVFGPDYRFQTNLGYSGEIRNDTLFGNIVIQGGGDPSLGSHYFKDHYFNPDFIERWVSSIQNAGIKVIMGNIVADGNIYEKQMIPNTWIWEDIGNYYGAGACGLTVYDNMYEIHLESGKQAGELSKIIKIVPEIPDIEFINTVRSSNEMIDNAYVFGSIAENKRILRGTIPKNRADFVIKASIPNPAYLLAWQFKNELNIEGISVFGNPVCPDSPIDKFVPLGNILSPPLKEIINILNHESVNLFGEHLLKHLAYQAYGHGSTKEGIHFIENFWNEKGIDMSGFFMEDGSGLSRFNNATATQIAGILNYMKKNSLYFNDYYQSLPTVGTGTLYVFENKNFPNKCLRAKSGSMTRVRCYAGYLKSDSGRELIFTIMLNNFSASQHDAIERIEEVLIELRKL